MPRPMFVLCILLGALALAAAGCGESDEDKFADEGNAICKDLESKSKAAEQKFQNPQSAEDIEAGVAEINPVIEEGERRFRELDPPDDLKDDLDGYVAQLDAGQKLLDRFQRAAAEAFESRNTREIERVGREIQELDRQTDASAEKLGFDECKEESG